MSTQPPKPQPQSDTVKTSGDIYGLGRSGGQRGAEILAGLRAISTPSPEAAALSTMMGRLITRTLISMLRNKGAINYVFARSAAYENRLRQELKDAPEGALLVEIAAGLSPRGLTMAREFPHIQVIDIDQQDVVDAKRQRIENSRLNVPSNLTFVGIDLGVEDLQSYLDGRKAYAIAAEGLVGYLDETEFDFLLSNIYRSLRPNGLFVADISRKHGIGEAMEHGGRIFSRQAGRFKVMYEDEQSLRDVLQAAGFKDIVFQLPSSVAKANKLDLPVIDIAWVVSSRKA